VNLEMMKKMFFNKKRKPRKNTTKVWFPGEVSTSNRDTKTIEDMVTTR
jgi:hypothetical protein